MTNYITSVGIQHFSMTIASGSLTATVTITAVGSGAFIIYGGINPSVTSNAAEADAYLTLTNSTTITATRTTSTAGTVFITGCIIDGDTTNLIKSIQFGTVTVGAGGTSGTATITAVTNNNTAIGYLGQTTSLTSWTANDNCTVSLSGTTVTATKGGISGGANTVGFVAIEFQGAALNKAVQNVSAASSSSVTSYTATITSVTTGNALCIYGGWADGAATGSEAATLLSGQLTNATTVTINVNTASTNAKTYNCCVVEFIAGLLNSSVQRGTTTLTGAASNTSTITSVTKGNSGINYLGHTSSATVAVLNQSEAAAALTNNTTVTTTKNTALTNATSSWEVFEFPAFSGGVTQKLNSIWFGAIA